MKGLYSLSIRNRNKELDMAKGTVRFMVDFTIADGKFETFERISKEMIAVSQNEPGTLAYDWYLSADRMRCRLYESYIDGDAVLAHLSGPAVQTFVPQLLETSKLTGFEVYGDPGPAAAKMLAGFGADLFQPWLAISR
jgi:quinol monooxygenase YgiN